MSDEVIDNLWKKYKRDGDKKWLETMLYLGVFEEIPMGMEIANAFSERFAVKTKSSEKSERDDLITMLYASLDPNFDEEISIQARNDILYNFPNMNDETLRSVLRFKKYKIEEARARNKPKRPLSANKLKKRVRKLNRRKII